MFMKIFAIKNENSIKVFSYLVYYEIADKFYIEIDDKADEWSVPFYLSAFVKRGVFTVNAKQSSEWVRQRIIPPDRQNIGQILKDNGLKNYREYELLMLGEGRCAQDDYSLEQIAENDLPKCIKDRIKKRIDDVIPLFGSNSLLVFFGNSKVKLCKINKIIQKYPLIDKYLSLHPEELKNVKVEVGGTGISWNESLVISDSELYKYGTMVKLAKSDFLDFISMRVVNTAEAAKILNCSRQNIDDLIKRGKLKPIKEMANDKLFLKSDILKREWQ